MTSKEQAIRLCKEGDQQFAAEHLALATAFYTAAFSCNIPMTIAKVASLAQETQEKIIATLERWCRGISPIPKVPRASLNAPSPSVGIAAIFLSTLSPNNIAASLCKMEALLRLSCYKEVVSQCNSLLAIHDCVELVLTRALALVLSQMDPPKGVADYLAAFMAHQDKVVEFVSSWQKGYLEEITQAFLEFLSLLDDGRFSSCLERLQRDCHEFLAAVAPEGICVYQAQATHLLKRQKYEECISVYTKALQVLLTQDAFWDKRTSSLLMDRASAYFSLGGKVSDMLKDLTAAFEISPDFAKKRFVELFAVEDTRKIQKHAKAILRVEFTAYREAVHLRTEIRSDSGKKHLLAMTRLLHFLIEISPEAKRELEVRLADCYVLEGNIQSALEICSNLLDSKQETYYNTLLALQGFCFLHIKNYEGALQDFQKIIEYGCPHPSSCVKALCGRGLIRALDGSPYLTFLDYVTASGLRFEETSYAIRSYIPCNQRGFLLVALQEEARRILERGQNPSSTSDSQQDKPRGLDNFQAKEGEALRVHQLASLLVKVDASDDTSQILCADALYQMDRLDEAHKVLMETLPQASQRSAILSRLSFLELKKGSSYVSNQLLKEIIQSGKTSCFLPVMKILKEGDRTLMQHHCRAEATSVLRKKQGDNYVKEAIGHLTLALITAGGYDAESLLARACCYGQLGQKKTAMFDLNAILKEDPTNAHALSGKGFIHLALNQKKEAIHDLISAFKANPGVAVAEILSLKQEAQMRLHQWLQDHCKTKLRDQVGNEDLVAGNTSKDLAIVAELLLQIYSKSAKNHILYVDALAIVGRSEEALDYLQGAFGCSTPDDSVNSRIGMLQAQKGNVKSALRILAPLAAKDFADLNYLMGLLDAKLRHSLAQAAARKGSTLLEKQHHTKALGYYSLAILASNGNPQFLRQRARCLAHLKEYRKALEDMSRVVQNHARSSLKTQVKDYCLQGQMLLCLSEEALAVQQYIKALELEKSLTLTHLPAHPEAYAKAFLQTAQSCLAENNYEEAWKITGYGLLIHPNNNELKKLRSVIKQETSACRVQ